MQFNAKTAPYWLTRWHCITRTMTLRSTSCVSMPKVWCITYRYLEFLLKIYLHIHFCEDLRFDLRSDLERLQIRRKKGIRDLRVGGFRPNSISGKIWDLSWRFDLRFAHHCVEVENSPRGPCPWFHNELASQLTCPAGLKMTRCPVSRIVTRTLQSGVTDTPSGQPCDTGQRSTPLPAQHRSSRPSYQQDSRRHQTPPPGPVLSRVDYYELLDTCSKYSTDVSDMSENIIKQSIWNMFSCTVQCRHWLLSFYFHFCVIFFCVLCFLLCMFLLYVTALMPVGVIKDDDDDVRLVFKPKLGVLQ